MDASEAVIAAPYIKSEMLTAIIEELQEGSSIQCFTRWTPQDIARRVSDLDCRRIVVEGGGTFWLNNRLHAKYYRFDDRVLVGSANVTGLGLGYPNRGNLEILCEPGSTFVQSEFETFLKQGSRKVSDDEFMIWQQCPVTEESVNAPTGQGWGADLRVWRPRARYPHYLWLYYIGKETSIVSEEQRDLAKLDLLALQIPQGLTKASFYAWVSLCLDASPLVESVRHFRGQTNNASAWDPIAEEWGISRAIAERWASTAAIWLRYFDPDGAFWGESP
ncbi:MAG: hypothetical protein OXH10_03605 [bacterium]|nr:hypothetical protein [bacterium]